MRFLKNALLVLISLALSAVVAEGVVRYIDGYPILRTPLGEPMGFGYDFLTIDRDRYTGPLTEIQLVKLTPD